MSKKKKKKKAKRKHEVRAELSNVELVRAGSSLTLQVYRRDQKIGEIHVGRGSLFWWGQKRQSRKRIDWSSFADMMDELAYG